MTHDSDPALQPIQNILHGMGVWMSNAVRQLAKYDGFGDARQQPEGSEERRLAEFRDSLEVAIAHGVSSLNMILRERARVSRNQDLLVTVLSDLMGNGLDALESMKRYHEIHGDETCADGTVPCQTFPDLFAWDTYERVIALNELVETFPAHIRHSAREMYGWPMIISHHLDGTAEFKQIAGTLELGAEHPFDTRPRPRRGSETPLLRYLEPLVVRLHTLRKFLIDTEETRRDEPFIERIQYWWWDRPLILLEDVMDSESCHVPALADIWGHPSVKSAAAFKSRLNKRVTATLRPFLPKPGAESDAPPGNRKTSAHV